MNEEFYDMVRGAGPDPDQLLSRPRPVTHLLPQI